MRRVPAKNLVGELNQVLGGCQRVARALAHHDVAGFRRPVGQHGRRLSSRHLELDRVNYATTIMDKQALRLLGSVALARAARGDETERGRDSVLNTAGDPKQSGGHLNTRWSPPDSRASVHPAQTCPHQHMNLDHDLCEPVRPLRPQSFRVRIARRHVGDHERIQIYRQCRYSGRPRG